MQILFSPPDITEKEIDEVANILKSGWITTGPKTKEFERRIAVYCGTPRAVCLSSSTAAMETTLRVLGIGSGDEVITTAYTYTATAAAIYHTGATIVLADTEPDSFEINYNHVEKLINGNTKAIMPVDIGGRMCDYSLLTEIAESKENLFKSDNEHQAAIGRPILIADSAHGFGSKRNGTISGQAADFTIFSFHAVKNLTTAEGGAVVWKSNDILDDEQLYREFMLYSLHGQSKDALDKTKAGGWEYDILLPGFKCNMTDIQAAIGLAQLERYDQLLAKRREIIEKYDRALKPIGVLPLEHFANDIISSGHLYLARIPGISSDERNRIIEQFAGKGIATNVHYKPLPMLTAYKKMGFDIENYPNAYNQYKNEISLPLHTLLTDEEVDYICDIAVSILSTFEVST